jgi:hypothetical protein
MGAQPNVEGTMTAMNIVHMRVKPGREADFLKANQDFVGDKPPGARRLWVVKTGERQYCIVGEWDSFEAIVAARPQMIASLDRQREMLEDLGGGRGVTEPWSGDVVVEVSGP